MTDAFHLYLLKYCALFLFLPVNILAQRPVDNWTHLSSSRGDLPVPWASTQQTSAIIADIDGDGVNDFILGCREKPPVLVWYRRVHRGWQRYSLEKELKTIEAGGASADIDGDGDVDLVFGQDWQGPEVWWWENPYPNYDPDIPWKRHTIKISGKSQHHDQAFGDFLQTGKLQLAFWNQGNNTIYLATIPDDPGSAHEWELKEVFSGQADNQTGWYPEGMAAADVDGDGHVDLLAGNMWFKYEGNGEFRPVHVAAIGGRIVAAKLKKGKTLQIVTAPGDGIGPVKWYECIGDPADSAAWIGHTLAGRDLIHGHTLAVADINGDGYSDIFTAEMAKWNEKNRDPDNPGATAFVFYGDGKGGFKETIFQKGLGFHEAKLGDLDGDGDIDILDKPYNWNAPRVDVFLQNGTGKTTKGTGYRESE